MLLISIVAFVLANAQLESRVNSSRVTLFIKCSISLRLILVLDSIKVAGFFAIVWLG